MSLIFPKKEILYAPMLGTLGGGSVRGFGRYAGGSGLVNGFGPEYDGWTGDRIAINAGNGAIATTGDSDWEGLQGHISHYLGGWYASYNTTSYFGWPNANSTYPSSPTSSNLATYYNINPKITFSTNQGSSGRGITIGYLGDETPVIMISMQGNQLIHFYHTDQTYIGSREMTGTDVGSGSSWFQSEWTNLMYDGSGFICGSRADMDYWFHFTMPSDTSLSDGCVQDYKWIGTGVGSNAGYGGAYLGKDSLDRRYIAFNANTTAGTSGSGGGAIWRLDATVQGQTSGNRSVISSSMDTGAYSAMVDYKNRKLLFGAHNNSGVFNVYGE